MNRVAPSHLLLLLISPAGAVVKNMITLFYVHFCLPWMITRCWSWMITRCCRRRPACRMGSPPAPHYSAPAQSFHGMDVDFDKLVWKQVVILHGQGVLNWKLFGQVA